MKVTKRFYLVIVIILLIISLIQFMVPNIGTALANTLTTITTIIGLFSVFFEMKRNADVAECEFIFNLQKQFDDSEKIQEIYYKLDFSYSGENQEITKEDKRNIVTYLTFFEMMCNLIIKGALDIKDIDDLFAYPFFIALNNKQIQKIELLPNKEFYQNLLKVYPIWKKYRKLRNKVIPLSENEI